MNIVKGQGMPDFVMLDKLDENSFLANIRERFNKKQIYTYIGEQIVAMNPFQKLDIYTPEVMKGYRNRYMYEVQPHIYALADDTFRLMLQDLHNQCVLITGESGAGKTECSKIFMQYIVMVSGNQAANRGLPGAAETIKQRLLNSNPVLEAFGNAKTLRNDNSSRFGKYMEIQFDGGGAPGGGNISQYLLEKSRVVVRANDERNFHIFYQVLSDAALRSSTKLGQAKDYACLNNSGCFSVSTINDTGDFTEVKNAMDELGFEQKDKDSVWRILAAILHLSNVQFDQLDQAKVSGKSKATFDIVKGLLGLNDNGLNSALTTRDIETAGKVTIVPLNQEQSMFARDSMCKALYTKVFDWVVETINKSLRGDRQPDVVIGVLDIYGFEIFQVNSFEQFCINYCNEKLQQLFIDMVLKQEQEEYKKEGIEWSPIPYFNNQPIIDLIEKNPGILKLLDETCMVGNPTHDDFLRKLDTAFAKHEFYASFTTKKDKSIARTAFRVTHYAGVVDYDITEFIFKNKDTLHQTIQDACSASSDALVKDLFPNARSKQRPVTAGTQFKTNVGSLVTTLRACQPHYIRCIKSNDKKGAFVLDEERVKHQVAYLNLVETVKVRRAGFCNRQPYNRFLPRYKMICDATWPRWDGDPKEGCAKIIQSLGFPATEYRLGVSKIFIKSAATLTKLEEVRNEKMHTVAVTIQRQWRILRVESKVFKLFNGKKPHVFLGPNSFQGDYVSSKDQKTQIKLQDALKKLFAANGDKDVKFIATVAKINKSAKAQERIFLLTDKHVYNLKPGTYKDQWAMPLQKGVILGLHMTTKEDAILVIKTASPNKDLVLDMAYGCDVGTGQGGKNHLVELVYAFRLLTSLFGGGPVDVTFEDSITYNNSRKPGKVTPDANLTVGVAPKGPKIQIKGGAKGAQILIPASTVNCKECGKPAFTLNYCSDHIARAADELNATKRRLSTQDAMLHAFAVFDKDGTGQANAGELRHVLTNLGERLSDDEVSEMLKEADPRSTGSVDYRMFIDLMARMEKG